MKKEVVYPLNWRLVKVEDASEILDSQRIPINAEHRSLMQGNIPYYGANGIQGYINKYIFDEDLILLAEDGGYFEEYFSRPIAYKVSGKSWVNNHAHILRIKNDFDYNYVFYSLVHKNILPFIKGGTRSKLNQLELRAIEFIAPLLPEQQRIAEILTTIDTAIEKTEALIEKYKNIKQGMMQDLLTKGIDESGNIRSEENHEFKDSPIGRIPKEWDALNVEATVDSVMDFRGKTPLKIGMDWGGGEIPAISANNVVMGKIDLSKGTYYGSEALYKKWMVKGSTQKGDVIITMEAPLGNIAQIPNDDKYILSQRVLLLRTRSELLTNEYIAQVFMSDEFQKQLNKYASGTTAQGIQQAKLFELYIPVPKLTTEQKRICDYINTINKKICMEENYLKKLCFMKQGLMQDLLTGKVRVPLEEATG